MNVRVTPARFWVIVMACDHEEILVRPARITRVASGRKRYCKECGTWQQVTETFHSREAGTMIRTASDRRRGL